MSKVLALLAIGFAVYYWSYTQKLKSTAIRAAKIRCRELGVQFLDESVVQNKFTFTKDAKGNRRILREYLFEFTSTGEQRYKGVIQLLGHYVNNIETETFSIN